jgi:molybdenum cofactor cytidylyltransferase
VATGPHIVGDIHALVLAAGSGVRFGGGKLLAPWRGAPLLHRALAVARAAPVASVTVVTGADADPVAACVAAFDPTIQVVHAADHAEGMAASLRAGVRALPPNAEGVIIFLGDMPRVPDEVPAALAGALRAGALAAAPDFEGQRGNPVALARSLFSDVAALTGDRGARGILDSLGSGLRRVAAPDDGVLFDVDRPEDLSPGYPRPRWMSE